MKTLKNIILGTFALLLAVWGLSGYVGPLVVTHGGAWLTHLVQGRPVTPETVAQIAKIGQVQATILSGLSTTTEWASSLCMTIGFILIVWLGIDLTTGQLMRDWKTPNAIRAITSKKRFGAVDDAGEEDLANKVVRRLRIKKREGKLVATMWMAPNGKIERIIQARCDEDLRPWLTDKFQGSSWKPMARRHWGPITVLEMHEK